MDGKTFIFSQQKEESFQNYLGSIKGALKNTTDRLLGLYSLKLAFPLVYSRFANSRFGTRILAKIKPKMNRFHPLWWPQLSHTPYTILHHTRFVCFFFFFLPYSQRWTTLFAAPMDINNETKLFTVYIRNQNVSVLEDSYGFTILLAEYQRLYNIISTWTIWTTSVQLKLYEHMNIYDKIIIKLL